MGPTGGRTDGQTRCIMWPIGRLHNNVVMHNVCQKTDR